jgi:hypothetical protein
MSGILSVLKLQSLLHLLHAATYPIGSFHNKQVRKAIEQKPGCLKTR